ncbi:hypothetical protein BSL78_22696, partial [Apostichopus japonicus]
MEICSLSVISCYFFSFSNVRVQCQGEPLLVVLEEDVEINCYFESADSDFLIIWKGGNLEPLTHRFDESAIKIDDRRISTIGTNGRTTRLQITNTTFKDGGSYTCHKLYLVSGEPETCEWLIIVQGVPQIVNVSTAWENEIASAECCSKSTDTIHTISFLWTIGSKLLLEKTRSTNNVISEQISSSCSNVSFVAKRRYHDQTLKCLVKNERNAFATVQMKVLYPATVRWVPQHPSLDILVADSNGNVNITCTSDGNPSPDVLIQRLNVEDNNQWVNLSTNGTILKEDNMIQTCLFPFNLGNQRNATLRCFASRCIRPCTQDKSFL